MHLCVYNLPLRPPIFTCSNANWVEIRDDEGYLVLATIFLPGRKDFLMITSKDPDFHEVISNFEIPYHRKELCLPSPGVTNKNPVSTN